MQVRDKLKSVSTHRQPHKNLPTLRSSTLSKAIIALSKVDIDSRTIHRDKPIQSNSAFQREREHLRSLSGFSVRRTKENPSEVKTYTKTQLQFQNPSQFKLSLKDIKEEDQSPLVSQLIIDKAKISSKAYGIIKAYSANSHPGPMLSYNEDRICIVTNLTKTSVKQKQISFFGVYDGNNGVSRADYLRDHLHLTLAAEQSFPNDMESALKTALHRVSRAFNEDGRFSSDESTVSFVVLVTYSDQVHYLQSGNCKSVFSSGLGTNIQFPTKPETTASSKQSSKKSRSVGEFVKKLKGREVADVEYRKMGPQEALDFVLLGSEGVFENLKIREIGNKIWLQILRNRAEFIHLAIGEANNQLLADIFSLMGTKNTSLIIVAFEPITHCLQAIQTKDEICLPYMPKEVKQ